MYKNKRLIKFMYAYSDRNEESAWNGDCEAGEFVFIRENILVTQLDSNCLTFVTRFVELLNIFYVFGPTNCSLLMFNHKLFVKLIFDYSL